MASVTRFDICPMIICGKAAPGGMGQQARILHNNLCKSCQCAALLESRQQAGNLHNNLCKSCKRAALLESRQQAGNIHNNLCKSCLACCSLREQLAERFDDDLCKTYACDWHAGIIGDYQCKTTNLLACFSPSQRQADRKEVSPFSSGKILTCYCASLRGRSRQSGISAIINLKMLTCQWASLQKRGWQAGTFRDYQCKNTNLLVCFSPRERHSCRNFPRLSV